MKNLIVLLGSTGIGKTELSISLAKTLGAPIISADSRQIYKEIPIGTAAPSITERQAVPHYFVGTKSVFDYYSASMYEQDVLNLLDELFLTYDNVILTGGSMMYIDAVCKGMDDIPDVDPIIRKSLYERYDSEGLSLIAEELKLLDPVYYEKVDKSNYKRVIHAIEICLTTGKPFSSFHNNAFVARPFNIIKVGLWRERKELYDRINARVLKMIDHGLVSEACAMYPFRDLNALNTVGFKEIFEYFDGDISLDEAVSKIQKNTRVYARKQQTWWKRDADIVWFPPEDSHAIVEHITQHIR
ncbi:tRNA (adenosine(37)-N6)-dimethylallyltransferase MiaA [Porphyromonas pogonae]|uniref:tRNA (adenosine(37)-N6)-dimethylallyltransferase MiaA n=1 Tax=Porphyromonas pogonae TaxID=867595 RepID=UPI0038B4F383